jgi:hypothetical protein
MKTIMNKNVMKYGVTKHYWNDYAFQTFVTYQSDMVLLAGIPENPSSMPHSEESQKKRGDW